jgi:hypothetical protein
MKNTSAELKSPLLNDKMLLNRADREHDTLTVDLTTTEGRQTMEKGHRITLDLPDEIFTDLADFQKRANIRDTNTAVFELLRYALSLPPYFREFDWNKAEADADEDIAAGEVKTFDSVEEFLADLKA